MSQGHCPSFALSVVQGQVKVTVGIKGYHHGAFSTEVCLGNFKSPWEQRQLCFLTKADAVLFCLQIVQ